MNITTITIRQLPDAISLDVARNWTRQSAQTMREAIADWRDATGTGAYRFLCARWALRCIKDFRWHHEHERVVWRQTFGNRRAS